MKKVLLILVDALSDRFLRPLMDSGELPHFNAVRRRGQLRTSTSIFPSITHACLSSIATGVYPCEHHVLGGHYFLPDQEELVYYGTDPDIIFKKNIGDFFEDFMVGLNGRHLRARTIFQDVEDAGLEAANLNFMIFKGNVEHEVNMPFLLSLIPGVSDNGMSVKGPQSLYLGDFVKDSSAQLPVLDVQGGLSNWYGFQDESTGSLLVQLAEQRAFPAFSLAYFPANDYRSHSKGPGPAHHELEVVDAALGAMFDAYGGIDRFLDEVCLIITGDHSQSDIDDTDEASITLESVLTDFNVADQGLIWDEDEEVVVCSNLRAAQIYLREPTPQNLERALKDLLDDPRFDQIFWRAETFSPGEQGYYAARGQERLHFWRGDRAADVYGNKWDWNGELAIVDGQVDNELITFPAYPNAFERLAGILDSEASGQFWITARLGSEFEAPRTGIHRGGGSHGSLHVLDSYAPLLMAGNCGGIDLPEHPRLIDIKPLILSILGIA